jgi:gluconokinase
MTEPGSDRAFSSFAVVVAGPSGSGKSTVGRILAERLGAEWIEGDDLHPLGNLAKMAIGLPLEDADRAPWLAAIGSSLDERMRMERSCVVSCSALRRRYRDVLRAGRPRLWLAMLVVSPAELENRLARRKEHFMPAALLASQLADLEPVQVDEPRAFAIPAEGPLTEIAEGLLARLIERLREG